ncbi:putative G-protein coupled receptor-like protein [Leptotrombidium deliense]|uniref:Putative G-protein coupled receptor-like protein n=1 Tax=Leptotrombidium deliense TaxID=299467 RepID=A0A443S902_9ACAR|nr:putative G-protein coupled receptor-like protein [Leptotrombidium deliense]
MPEIFDMFSRDNNVAQNPCLTFVSQPKSSNAKRTKFDFLYLCSLNIHQARNSKQTVSKRFCNTNNRVVKSVSYPTECKTWCTMQNAGLAITCTYLIVPICCTPVYLSFTIVPMTLEDNSMNPVNYSSIFRVDWSEIALQNGELLKKINFWVFSVATKLVPCMLLTYLSLALIRVLVEADKRKQRLHQNKLVLPDARSVQDAVSTHDKMQNDCNKQSIKKHSTQEHNSHVCVQSSSSQSSDRTTRMLLAVLLLFLITEFPSGILVLISGIIGERFHREYYSPLGELLDMLALVNSAINFILYCSMSRLFRKTFTKLFCTASWSDERYERENETVHVAIANLDKKRTKIMTATGSGQEPKTKATYV